MATITVTKQPNDWEMANGNVIVTLYDTDEDGGQVVVRFLQGVGAATVLNEIRQLPNAVGYYHFDLQKLITNQMAMPPNPEGTLPNKQLNTADGAIANYRIQYGYIANDVFVPSGTLATVFTGINGRKAYFEIDWTAAGTATPYLPTISSNVGNNTVDVFAPAATDKNIYPTKLGSDYTDLPSWGSATSIVHPVDILRTSYENLSWLNGWEDGTPAPLSTYNGINGYYVDMFNAAGASLGALLLLNTTTNNGGPNVAFNDAIDPTGKYQMIGVKVGPANNTTLAGQSTLDHYYVAPFAYIQDPDVSLDKTLIGDIYRYQIIPPECKDYDVIQMAWINSFGNFDYFDFQKKNVRTDAITRNNYNPIPESWSGTNVTISTYTRGKTTFSTEVVENQTATTRYISEYDSQYLKNLYRSPSAFCRYAGDTTWTPVILTSNAWTEKTVKNQNRRLFQHEIAFNKAWNPQIQNG